MTAVAKHEMDLTTGSILKKLIRFSIPIILVNILQLLFNVADIAVLGMLVGDMEVGAVGSTSALIHLIVNLFIGLSVGTNVVLAKCVGEHNMEKANKIVGTSVLLSVILGFILCIVGFFGARTFLTWMNCDAILLDNATLYLKIYFLGMPIIMLYNFMASIMRAVGDTLRPMIFLLIAGVVNVGLNVFFILVFDMSVDGVAIATVASNGVSALLAIIVALKSKGYGKLRLRFLKIDKEQLLEIVKIGIPSGLQSSMFSISNVFIQSTINSYGALATTGNAVSNQFDQIVGQVGASMALACMSFVSQNRGAGEIKRIRQVIVRSIIVASIISFTFGNIMIIFSESLCKIMSVDPQVIWYAKQRMYILGFTFFLAGIMDILNYSLRALGRSVTAMVISLCFACVFRILWLKTFYLIKPTFLMIFISYPISWVLNIVVAGVVILSQLKKEQKIIERKKLDEQESFEII